MLPWQYRTCWLKDNATQHLGLPCMGYSICVCVCVCVEIDLGSAPKLVDISQRVKVLYEWKCQCQEQNRKQTFGLLNTTGCTAVLFFVFTFINGLHDRSSRVGGDL